MKDAFLDGVKGAWSAVKKGAAISWDAIRTVPEEKDRAIGLLNGLVGDQLAARNLELAIVMGFYKDGEEIEISRKGLKAAHKKLTNKICILVHGSCDSEKTWEFKKGTGVDYGSLLQKDFGYTPFYLRYNSGLHISENGQKLASLMQHLWDFYPKKISEILMIGHSMGGLVVRSAGFYGAGGAQPWVQKVKKVFLVGTPHAGARLEKAGALTTAVLGSFGGIYTRSLAGIINVRSAGIKDLSHGYLVDEDWSHGADKLFKGIVKKPRTEVPLLEHAQYYVIAGTLSKNTNGIIAKYLGDGLVHPRSARDLHKDHLFPEENFVILPNAYHLRLASSERVYPYIRSWVEKK